MYAVFEDGSRQYRVTEGDVVKVDYREAEAGASIHVATSRFAYELLPCAPCRLTTPAVIRLSPSNSDGTRSGSFIVVVDRTTSRMAVAI